MFRKSIIATAAACSLALTPVAAPAGNDALLGVAVGAILGAAASNQKKTVKRSSGVSSATRTANRETQTALNYFGFNAGTPDGVFGSRSRSAAMAYQRHLGYTPTGQLTQFERDFLISSYYRAQSGGPNTAQLVASNPQGIAGLLIIYRDEQLNGGSGTASIGGHYGLPPLVAASVNEIARSSDPSAEQLVQRHGFIQLADINGDGQTDYIIDTTVTGSAFWCSAQACAVRVFASTPEGYERNDFQAFNVTPAMFTCQRGNCSKTGGGSGTQMAIAPQPQGQMPQTQMVAGVAPAANTPMAPGAGAPSLPVASAIPAAQAPVAQAAAPAMPNFFGTQTVETSLASHCNKVALVTSTNGGYITAASMTDANLALSEQMCLARTYAISAGEDLMSKVQGVTRDQIAVQCQSFVPMLKDSIAAVSLQPRDAVLQGVTQFVLKSGMSPAQMEATAKICLSSGYATDDMDVAIGSSLLLIALGNAPYSELLGHHLSQGFGASERKDLAMVWYTHALDALEGGSAPAFAAGQPERVTLLRQASAALSGAPAPAAPMDASATSAMPLFKIAQ